jgi:SAM-dependent methyltransferase
MTTFLPIFTFRIRSIFNKPIVVILYPSIFMQQSFKQDPISVIDQNISYYDEIAEQYDELLDRDRSNDLIREKVAATFCKLVPQGWVLDFGGGTGKDLDWLSEKGYRTIFCEPSVNMREKAVLRSKKNPRTTTIVFLENDASNFTTWETHLPFSQKAGGVLANFAVLNSIPDLQLLFKNLSLVIQPGGHLLMLALKSDFKKRWSASRRATLLSLFTGTTVTADLQFNGQRQKVHLYTVKKIKKLAATYFYFQSDQLLKEKDFILIHLTRK